MLLYQLAYNKTEPTSQSIPIVVLLVQMPIQGVFVSLEVNNYSYFGVKKMHQKFFDAFFIIFDY